jgi:hypothetical protein
MKPGTVQSLGQGLFVEEAEQGLIGAFVLALRRGFIRFPRDRLDPERSHIGDKLAEDPRRDGFNAAPLSDSSRCGTP